MAAHTFSFTRYLAAKSSVDDRALNRRVWGTLVGAVRARPRGAPLRVLEVGGGIGTMVERLVEWGLLAPIDPDGRRGRTGRSAKQASITMLDVDVDNVAEARRRLRRWATEREFGVDDGGEQRLLFRRADLALALELEAIDLLDFATRERGRFWDLLLAHAVLDDVDIAATLAALLPLLERGGLFYFSITFDGTTTFQPEIDRALDDQIETLYHRAMDRRELGRPRTGGSRAGRRLFHLARGVGAEVLDMGASDWVVFPRSDGYAADEAYFLHYIVHTMEDALSGHPELDPERFADWIALRHAQIEGNELVYIAHQLDLLGRVPP